MLRRFLPRVLFGVAFFSGLFSSASVAAVQDRIVTAVSNSSRVAIPNSVHGQAKAGTDLGATDPSMKLVGMTMRFSLTDAQTTALDQLLANQQNPASPQYHQWLTPAQYGAQFGLSAADLAKVTAWLTSEGFTVDSVAAGNNYVTFSGTVGQAESAFATTIHNVSYNNEKHFANISDVSVPNALGSVVMGVTGLHNFRLKPKVRASVVKAPVKTEFTSSISGSHYLAPGDFYTIYDEQTLLNNSINGTGVTIAVVGQTDILASDILAFRSASGLSATAPTVVLTGCDPGIYSSLTVANETCDEGYPPSSDDLAESSLDLEWAGAVAPSATITFVNSNDVIDTSLPYAVTTNIAPIISVTYGLCEAGWGSAELNTLNATFKQANAQGQTIVAAAGDDGAADCDAGTSAIEGLAVDFPGSSPYVTAIGGTMFNEGSGTYWNTSNGTNQGSALTYIPEKVWNEDSTGETFSAGDGGVSAFFAKPAWQTGSGVPADGSRDVPDISLDAGAGHDPYLYCAAGSCVTGYRASDGQSLTVAGGTSFGAPTFSGILALIEQKTGGRIGNANQTIYALASSTYATGVFHDTTVGNNADPCTAGTPNCPYGGTIGYTAAAGYDLASGWGSVDAAQLTSDWALVTPLGIGTLGANQSVTNLTASTTTATAGATITLTATVSGSNGTPTGTVKFLIDKTVVGSPVTLVSGVATYSYVTSCSALGNHTASAAYSGDANYQGSIGPVLASGVAGGSGGASVTSNGSITTSPLQLTVSTGACPDFSITPASTSLSAASLTSSSTLTINVASLNSFAGSVYFTATSTSNSSGYAPVLSFSVSPVTLTAGGSGTTVLSLSAPVAELQMPQLHGGGSGIEVAGNGGKGAMPWYAAGSGVTIASLLLLVLPRRRRWGALLMIALSLAAVGGVTGCSSSGTASVSVTPVNGAGTYTVTITGTYTSSSGVVTAHTQTVSYVVP